MFHIENYELNVYHNRYVTSLLLQVYFKKNFLIFKSNIIF